MTLRRYITGYVFSLILTAASFTLVWVHLYTGHDYLTHGQLFAWIVALAVVQVVVQLVFFLHIGKQSKMRDLVMLALAGVIIFLVVGGSLWIMQSLSRGEQANPNSVLFPGGVSPQGQDD